MATHLGQRGEELGGDVTERKQTVEEEEMEGATTAGRKRRKASVTVTTGPVGGGFRPCVSLVIRVEQKEGVVQKVQGVGLTHCFSVRAAVVGPVVSWGRDPKNGPVTDRETETEREDKVRH